MKKSKFFAGVSLLTAAAMLAGCSSEGSSDVFSSEPFESSQTASSETVIYEEESSGVSNSETSSSDAVSSKSASSTAASSKAASSKAASSKAASSKAASSKAASSKAASSKAASSKAASSKAASSKAASSKAASSKAESSNTESFEVVSSEATVEESIFKASYNPIPADVFRFSSSSYSNSDFRWYSETTGTGVQAQVKGIYRYNDYLVALLEHYGVNSVNSYRETRFLSVGEGEQFLQKEASYKVKQDYGQGDGAGGGRFERYEIKVNDSSSTEVEKIDISYIDFGKVYYDGFDYESDSWSTEMMSYNEWESYNGSVESARQSNWSTKDRIPMYGTSTNGLLCVTSQLSNIVDFPFVIRGGAFVDSNGDTTTIDVYLISIGDQPVAVSPGAMYRVTFNYYSLVLSVDKVS